jgi:hypothetical protein
MYLHDACTAGAVFVARQSVAAYSKYYAYGKPLAQLEVEVSLLLVNLPSLTACSQLHHVFTSGRCLCAGHPSLCRVDAVWRYILRAASGVHVRLPVRCMLWLLFFCLAFLRVCQSIRFVVCVN